MRSRSVPATSPPVPARLLHNLRGGTRGRHRTRRSRLSARSYGFPVFLTGWLECPLAPFTPVDAVDASSGDDAAREPLQRCASVDCDGLPGDVARRVRGEVHGDALQVVITSEAA